MRKIVIGLLLIGVLGYIAVKNEGIDIPGIKKVITTSGSSVQKFRLPFPQKKALKKEPTHPSEDASLNPMSPLAPPESIITLTNGSVLRGVILEKDAHVYRITMGGGTITLATNEVKSVISSHDEAAQKKQCTFYLKNGKAIRAFLLSEDEHNYHLEYESNRLDLGRQEVERIEDGSTLTEQDGIHIPEVERFPWTFRNNVVLVLTNGTTLDQEIVAVTKTNVTTRTVLEEGGSIEQDIARETIDHLLFRRIDNETTQAVEEKAAALFPSMKRYEEGNLTIVTDSFITWVRQYKQELLRVQTDLYLTFFALYKKAPQRVQHVIVIFDDPENYIEYAVTDGVPGWIAPGYFSPDEHMLYLFNLCGDHMIASLDACMKEGLGKVVDTQAERIKSQVDERYHVFVEGEATGIKNKYWRYLDWYKARYRAITGMILRHEFTHAFFSNHGLVGVVISKMDPKDAEIIEKKKNFLKEENIEKKKRIFQELATLRSQEVQPEVKAANSWLSEGLATYGETESVGQLNEERMYAVQKLQHTGGFLPLEQLTAYKLGSFPGVYHAAMVGAYGQSWALVHFLMDRYPAQFMKYIERVSQEEPADDEDILWLLEAVGKDARSLEAEIDAYIKTFPSVADPLIEEIDKLDRLKDDLMTMGDV